MSLRLKTGIWVEAFLRQAAHNGQYGAVVHKGHEDAGQVIVLIHRPDRMIEVLGPPPGPAHDDEGNRRFELAFQSSQEWQTLKPWLDKKQSFDSDLWIVEIDAREGFAGLTPEKR
jgi:hypothetical protein